MRRVMLRVGAAFGLGFMAVLLPVAADDAKPGAKEKEPDASKAPTFPGYVFVSDVVGEVVRADDKSVKLRITWFDAVIKGGNNNNNRRPNLNANNRNFANPFAANRNRPNTPQVQLKENHHDYELDYLPQSLVRTRTLPPKLDEKGKKVPHTQKEIDELRAPLGVTGYASNRSEIVPGTILEVYLIRDKSVAAEKATEADLRIKHAIILGQDPNPPKDIGSGGKEAPKKKDKN